MLCICVKRLDILLEFGHSSHDKFGILMVKLENCIVVLNFPIGIENEILPIKHNKFIQYSESSILNTRTLMFSSRFYVACCSTFQKVLNSNYTGA